MIEKSRYRMRSARPDDAAALLEIYGPVVRESAISFELEPPAESEFAERIRRCLVNDPWLVLERNGVIAGYAYASTFRDRPAYATTRETTVYVHPHHRGAGVGRTLLQAILDDITRRGACLAVAVIALPNDGSVALHEALGFEHAGTITGVARKFDEWHDEGLWTLRLGSS
jgi:L-amino acid N-acyltransferase YncA